MKFYILRRKEQGRYTKLLQKGFCSYNSHTGLLILRLKTQGIVRGIDYRKNVERVYNKIKDLINKDEYFTTVNHIGEYEGGGLL